MWTVWNGLLHDQFFSCVDTGLVSSGRGAEAKAQSNIWAVKRLDSSLRNMQAVCDSWTITTR